MKNDAESHAEEDKKRLAEIEARNQCDSLVYQAEKLLKENRDKVGESDAKSVDEAIEACRKALADGTVETIKSASEQLQQAMHKLAEAMYKATAAQAGAAQGGTGPSSDGAASAGPASDTKKPGQGDVIDAEFVDVDESKKPN
jgi:molecular chaperone DnaK